jgi:hypothetical protein
MNQSILIRLLIFIAEQQEVKRPYFGFFAKTRVQAKTKAAMRHYQLLVANSFIFTFSNAFAGYNCPNRQRK